MERIAFILMAAMLLALSCAKEGKQKENQPEESGLPVIIDGSFEDWEALSGSSDVYVAKNALDSQWPAVKEMRVYAIADKVFYYVRFDSIEMEPYMEENDVLPMRINLNTDGEFTTGYSNYFTQSYDFMIEGSLGNGEGGWASFDGTLYQRIEGKWVDLLASGSGLVSGAGTGYQYEMVLDRLVFNEAADKSEAPMPMGDTFQTSLRFYESSSTGKWVELSNIPNTSEGYGPLLEVNFAK